ncbi:MAG: ketopantoate reductase family protein [Chloroflexi bacterium]|jgi:2-dehydropantoate 2-reductase|nr:ketopantoate reductase family protein [Chloroflexota bacterium]
MHKKRWWWIGGLALGAAAAYAARRRHRALERQCAANREVRVLVVGAGVVGSTYAAQLARRGVNVTLLARGERLQALLRRGLIVEDMLTGCKKQSSVEVISALPPDADYDLAIVAVRYGQTAEALEAIRGLADTTPILMLQNNPEGIDAFARRLGKGHLLMGFPATGGHRVGDMVRSSPLWVMSTVVGEADGAETQALYQALAILRRAGIRVEVERRMVPWLQTHAAEIAALAGVAYKNGGKARQMARNTQDIKLYLSALREAYAVLQGSGIPITPESQLAIFERPLWLQMLIVRAVLWTPWAAEIVDEHLAAAPEEMRALYDQVLSLAKGAGLDMPFFESLGGYFPKVE